MTDPQRPRPQFGEYATPEAQRNAIKVPLDDVESVPVQSQESPSSHITVQGVQRPDTSRQNAGSSDAAPRGAGRDDIRLKEGGRVVPSAGDRFATIALLGLGLITAFMTLPALMNLPAAIGPAFTQLGIGDFTTDDLAFSLGWGALITQVVVWGLALWLSVRTLRRGKLAWWIPLVAGVIANIVVIAAIAVAMSADPAFMEYVNQMSAAS